MNWYLKRLFRTFLTVFIVATLSFVLIRQLPGGPVQYVKAQLYQGASGGGGSGNIERINEIAEATINIKTTDPVYIQYIDYMTSIATGDFGQSVWYDESVAQILAGAAPWTVFLMGTSILIFFAIGIGGGAAMAYREASMADKVSSILSTFFSSIPFYIIGIILVWILGFRQRMFPTSGRIGYGVEPGTIDWFVSAAEHAILPITAVVLAGFGRIALQMRGNSIQVLGEDYVRVGRLRGLSDRVLSLRYVGQNAVLPMYTQMMISLGFMFGGSIVLERVFTYPGLGLYLFRAISARDYPLMMGCFILITAAVAIGILVADLTYAKIDPRASRGETSESY
jgi:peptide/nickel transport system permease protein